MPPLGCTVRRMDLVLCDECGERFDVLQSLANLFNERLSVPVFVKELCAGCLVELQAVVARL